MITDYKKYIMEGMTLCGAVADLGFGAPFLSQFDSSMIKEFRTIGLGRYLNEES